MSAPRGLVRTIVRTNLEHVIENDRGERWVKNLATGEHHTYDDWVARSISLDPRADAIAEVVRFARWRPFLGGLVGGLVSSGAAIGGAIVFDLVHR